MNSDLENEYIFIYRGWLNTTEKKQNNINKKKLLLLLLNITI